MNTSTEQHATAQHAHGSFLQSAAWTRFQVALGKDCWTAAGDRWSWSATREKGRGAQYLYCPAGPIVVDEAGLAGALESLRERAMASKLGFLSIEPRSPDVTAEVLRRHGLSAVTPVQPRLTSVVDLTRSLDALRGGLARGHRARIREAAHRGVSIRRSGDPADVAHFVRMIHDTSTRNRFRPFPDRYYRVLLETLMPPGVASLYLAEVSGEEPLTASIVIDHDGVRTYAHTAADQQRNRKLHAGTPLVWQMMLDAKQAGIVAFDLYGVSPADDAGHAWHGLSAFKRGFGGADEETVGTWELTVRPLTHLVHRVGRRLRR